ncbi:hypothetical protein DC522_15540 [Microvirga sp. KLBC 81]|nr:hypothetical protein DC522_15540 [Microvirga sp. KLBC 81]
MHLTPVERFVVFQVQNEWLVTYRDRTQMSYSTREEAETSAFDAADALASQGHAVSILIMPDEPDANGQHPMVLTGRTPRVKPS